MLQHVALTRYVVFVAVIAALAASVALIIYEAAVVAEVIFDAVRQGGFLPKSGRALAVGLIEAMDDDDANAEPAEATAPDRLWRACRVRSPSRG